eukprot:TRINITY_DN1192_c0_g1_i1.p2 TRINITY_DN1192_c0_g1~~TRINITY_DN1192_c0_g1_i1.p2  ORF type:complete len:84 (-),score=27.39 TRINITY_DN1192_c0_g1_i1:2-253(-)
MMKWFDGDFMDAVDGEHACFEAVIRDDECDKSKFVWQKSTAKCGCNKRYDFAGNEEMEQDKAKQSKNNAINGRSSETAKAHRG